MKEIPLYDRSGGVVATAKVDDEDYTMLAMHRWRLGNRTDSLGRTRQGYARRDVSIDGKVSAILMHRVIMQPALGQEVDHTDTDTLNNTRANLRLCSRAENARNRKPTRTAQSSGYKGVFFWALDRRGKPHKKPWRAKLTLAGRHVFQRSFATEREAAEAYDAAAHQHFGEFARPNFAMTG